MSYTYKCRQCGIELHSECWLDSPIVVLCNQCMSTGEKILGVQYYGIQVERRQGIYERTSDAEPRSADQRLKAFQEANRNAR